MQINQSPLVTPTPLTTPAATPTPSVEANAEIFNSLAAVSPTGGTKLDAISELMAEFRGIAGDESVSLRLA